MITELKVQRVHVASEMFTAASYTECAVNILLLATYELGRQPFGLASPAAWLRKRGHNVRACDLSREPVDEKALLQAGLIVFYLPMHTATRLALRWAEILHAKNPAATLCACGLYSQLNESRLRTAGFTSILGPEFETDLATLAERLSVGLPPPATRNGHSLLPRLPFELPDRTDLPGLRNYAHVVLPDGSHRTVGYTEASRGCKHLCRHCPIVPVYSGQFRVVPREIVLGDIRQQVAAGARHVTFGDPDFFNGVTHATRIVDDLHAEFPQLTYDATIKIEHLLRHADALPKLAQTGCLFITSAVESLDDEVLRKLDKGHTRADFFRTLRLCEDAGLTLQPTFVPFTPWTTRETYLDLLRVIADRDLVCSVPSVQLAIRLLIPSRSRLLELPELATIVGEFDEEKLLYPWRHSDAALDELSARIFVIVAEQEKQKSSRSAIFESIWQATSDSQPRGPLPFRVPVSQRAVPFLSEPWYC
ncbi:MAG TPA: CUAEP/CCAEP-tail radical SAM protein [Candidatus Acidoferrum sp.]|nr:CUAEP/CCAEP-tail radical SAM protein [Candidatus Acidoferrum sp.]